MKWNVFWVLRRKIYLQHKNANLTEKEGQEAENRKFMISLLKDKNTCVLTWRYMKTKYRKINQIRLNRKYIKFITRDMSTRIGFLQSIFIFVYPAKAPSNL